MNDSYIFHYVISYPPPSYPIIPFTYPIMLTSNFDVFNTVAAALN